MNLVNPTPRLLAAALCALLLPAGPALAKKQRRRKENLMADVKAGKDLYATIDTSMGKIVCKLFSKDAPATVANFVGLATGEKPWRDPRTGQERKGKPLYDGTTFHRVIPNFMIQGGDPLGTGTGGPGYQFADERTPAHDFNQPGILAMANAGPNTNGSQFFITEAPTPFLNDGPGAHYNIFGELVSGLDVVKKIARVPRNGSDRPNTPVVIERVEIGEHPPKL